MTKRRFFSENGTWLALFGLFLIMAVATQGEFISARNLTNLMRQTSINGILATGMSVIILAGGIDLSIGSIVALVGVIVGISQVNWGWGEWGMSGALASAGLALAVGLGAGILNGTLVSLLGIAPFVITLGMMVIARGLAMILSNGASISPIGDALNAWAGNYFETTVSIVLLVIMAALMAWRMRKTLTALVFWLLTIAIFSYAFLAYRGLPYLVFFFAACLTLVGFLLSSTTWGRSIFAVGSNERAAYWAGVPIRKVVFFAYSLMGALSGLAALLLTARLNGADPNAGQLFELDAIASVVIGGTSLKGGTGSIQGAFIGALIIATLNNGMDLLAVPSFYQMVFKGIIIITAVAVDRSQNNG